MNRHCHYDVMPLRTHADGTTQKMRHAWTCLPTMGIGIHCNIRIELYTFSFTAYTLLLLVSARTGVLHCFGFDLRLLTLYFYFNYFE